MKKLLVFVVLMMLVVTPALACEEAPVLPNIESSTSVFCTEAHMVISENHHIIGKLRPDEVLPFCPPQNVNGSYVTGVVDNGIIREKSEMRYFVAEEVVCGLTKLNVSVQIREEFTQAVKEVISRRLGEDAEYSASSIIACTIGRTTETLYHYFFSTQVNKVIVGTVTFNKGNATTPLYLGDWNGDGLNELGFAAGYVIQTFAPSPAPCKTTTETKSCTKKTSSPCGTTVVQVNFQLNLFSTVTNTQTVGCNPCVRVNCIQY